MDETSKTRYKSHTQRRNRKPRIPTIERRLDRIRSTENGNESRNCAAAAEEEKKAEMNEIGEVNISLNRQDQMCVRPYSDTLDPMLIGPPIFFIFLGGGIS
ncbi:hypothetical protein H5410_037923 [Solanum commersonii]|uniref:Uncharacterized protein n=1 Tax=Solanum commersonii TaxID=4109 RepID=A0A9J5Y7L5_SOLCO|nr:hypothetical protein H5410_037923 [Solanum commersonii]